MSPTGRPEGEYRSAKREGGPIRPTGRPEGEYRSAQREGGPIRPTGRPEGKYRSAQREGTLVNQRGAFVAVALFVAAALPAAAGAQRLLVVASGDAAPYEHAQAGVRKLGVPVDALPAGSEFDIPVAAAVARAGRDTAVVALGGRAAAAVARAAPPGPVVNCMVVPSDEARPAPGTLVVPLDVPADVHVQWLRRMLPAARSVGILFDPALNARRAEDVAAALRRAGYTAVLEPVPAPSALPGALARLTNTVDVLQAIPDTTVFAREHSRALLLFSFRNRIPLAGPTEAWVRAGALYSVDWDYADLGRYCGALALRQLAGPRAPTAPTEPARTRLTVNLRAADQLNVHWSADLLRAADKAYE